VVEFSSYEDMKNAIRKLDDTELKGKRIILREAPVNIFDILHFITFYCMYISLY
jgi:arginine/serine-rich splicing factor 4/5/6